jgi:hypothetical protein
LPLNSYAVRRRRAPIVTIAPLAAVLAAAFFAHDSTQPRAVPTSAPCPELIVTADGKQVDLPLGLGAKVPEARGGGYVVSRFNHREIDCATYLKASRPIVPGELEVGAYVGPITTNVRANTSNALGVPARVHTLPGKVGDPISICVTETVEHDPELSEGHRVRVAISGLLSGTFCGHAE